MKIRIVSKDCLIGVLLISICILVYLVIIPREVQGEIQRGMPPDFFPKLSVALVGFFAFFLLVKGLFSKAENLQSMESPLKIKEGRKGVILVICGTIFYLVLCSLISYIPSTILTLIILIWIFGERRWIMIVTAPLIATVGIYFLFGKLLSLQFPQGILF